jgi:hypothetical protein
LGSGGGGARDVLTEQNRHPLVQVSPNNYKKNLKKLGDKKKKNFF